MTALRLEGDLRIETPGGRRFRLTARGDALRADFDSTRDLLATRSALAKGLLGQTDPRRLFKTTDIFVRGARVLRLRDGRARVAWIQLVRSWLRRSRGE